jgi:hypothetical protein
MNCADRGTGNKDVTCATITAFSLLTKAMTYDPTGEVEDHDHSWKIQQEWKVKRVMEFFRCTTLPPGIDEHRAVDDVCPLTSPNVFLRGVGERQGHVTKSRGPNQNGTHLIVEPSSLDALILEDIRNLGFVSVLVPVPTSKSPRAERSAWISRIRARAHPTPWLGLPVIFVYKADMDGFLKFLESEFANGLLVDGTSCCRQVFSLRRDAPRVVTIDSVRACVRTTVGAS